MGEGDPRPPPGSLLFPQKHWQAPELRAGPCGPCILVLWGQREDMFIGEQAHICHVQKWLPSVWCIQSWVKGLAAQALPASVLPSQWRWYRAFLLSCCWHRIAFWEPMPWRCLARPDISSTWGKYCQLSVSQIFGLLAFLHCLRRAARLSQLQVAFKQPELLFPGLPEHGSLDRLQPWHLRREPSANSLGAKPPGIFFGCIKVGAWPAPSRPSSLYKHCWEKKQLERCTAIPRLLLLPLTQDLNKRQAMMKSWLRLKSVG